MLANALLVRVGVSLMAAPGIIAFRATTFREASRVVPRCPSASPGEKGRIPPRIAG
jgi:hypothetical protein